MEEEDQSPMCTFCNTKSETILMLECKHSQNIWHALQRWMKYFIGIRIDPTPQIIIMNNYRGYRSELVNMIMLIVKQYIYVKKYDHILPKFNEVAAHIISQSNSM